MILVNDAAAVRDILDSVYPALGLDWDPASVGSVEDLLPGITIRSVRDAVLGAYEEWLGPVMAGVPDAVTSSAQQARAAHTVPVPPVTTAGPP